MWRGHQALGLIARQISPNYTKLRIINLRIRDVHIEHVHGWRLGLMVLVRNTFACSICEILVRELVLANQRSQHVSTKTYGGMQAGVWRLFGARRMPALLSLGCFSSVSSGVF